MNNTTIASYGNNAAFQRYIQQVFLITMVASAVLIMVTNLSVFYAVLVKRALRKNMHYRLILSLSISDFLVGFAIFCVAFTDVYYYSCISMLSLVLVAESATMLQILLICLERIAILISSPLRHISLYIVLIWIISIAFGISPVLLWSRGPEAYIACAPQYIYGKNFWKQVTYMSVYFIIVYMLIVLAFVYLTLALLNARRRRMFLVDAATTSSRTAHTNTKTTAIPGNSSLSFDGDKKESATDANQNAVPVVETDEANLALTENKVSPNCTRKGESGEGSSASSQAVPTSVRIRERQHVKAMTNVAAIITMLTVCSLPYFLTILIDAHVVGGLTINTEARSAFMFVWLLNSAVNPVIYIIRIKEYREAIFPCKKR